MFRTDAVSKLNNAPKSKGNTAPTYTIMNTKGTKTNDALRRETPYL